jgi:hypothetical protein
LVVVDAEFFVNLFKKGENNDTDTK